MLQEMNKPTLRERKTARFNMFMTPRERALLQQIARVEERNESDMVRFLIRERANARGIAPTSMRE